MQEVVTKPGMLYPFQVRHVFVEGVGEVERQETVRLVSSLSQVVKEFRLVEK